MTTTEEDFLAKVKEIAQKELPYVLFKYPNKQEVYLIYQKDDHLEKVIDFTEKGFIIHPFVGNEAFLLRKDDCLSTILSTKKNPSSHLISVALENNDRETYKVLFEKAFTAISQKELKKVVLSRRITVTNTPFPLIRYFEELTNMYPTAFCYAFSHPKIGKWMAATPETLVKIYNGKLETMSLAGTKPFIEGEKPIWSEKEYKEQQIVTDNIVSSLLSLTESLFVGKIQEVRAGMLWHLCTKISARVPQRTSFQQIISSLHPTPAVCGYPREKARNFILENEGYPRKFYAGYCGLINFENENTLDLFVNLRCAEIGKHEMYIYVGGGVNGGSQLESEWQETENKAQTMLNIINLKLQI